jgi:ubiquinone/menaquinone biosynthesis C-methylase UbiE
MTSTDQNAAFAGSVPAMYHAHLGPFFFVQYARDLARRVPPIRGGAVLELACGTGIFTEELAARLDPTCTITATDLNDGMIEVARTRLGDSSIVWQTADAAMLPFSDRTFDLVACQFGIMFFPDKVAAAREARRVLKPRGLFLFNVWGTLDENPIARLTHEVIGGFFTSDPPAFYNVPFGYHDRAQITADLKSAGFSDIAVATVDVTGTAPSALHVATGLVQGSPVSHVIRERATASVDTVTRALADAIVGRLGAGEVRVPLRAHVFSAAG